MHTRPQTPGVERRFPPPKTVQKVNPLMGANRRHAGSGFELHALCLTCGDGFRVRGGSAHAAREGVSLDR